MKQLVITFDSLEEYFVCKFEINQTLFNTQNERKI